MSKPNNSHAIVIGGSMAGLWTARVLTDHFDRVTVIDRDRFPEKPEVRKGAPQAHHFHLLLARGLQILEQLFPGLTDELTVYGASLIDLAEDGAFLFRTGWTPRFHSGVTSFASSRMLLEWGIQRRLAAHPNVNFVESTEATGLLMNESKTQVTGVKTRLRPGAAEQADAEQSLTADLVVDASGRSTHTPDWLEAAGYDRPQETIVNSFLAYATRWYRRPANFSMQWRLLFVNARPPDVARGGGIFAVEDNQWVVTLGGAAHDHPPTDEAGFLEFSRSLITPALYEAIKDAEPISPIYGYQRTANQLRHYERLTRWPENFVALGDAACAFNPIYGQGMSVAAMGALALDDLLSAGQPAGMAQRFQKKLAEVNEGPWLLATGEDFRYPATEGGQRTAMTRFSHWYIDKVLLAMPESSEVTRLFMQVSQLLKPPTAMFQPWVMAVALSNTLKRVGKTATPSWELPALWQTEQKVSTF
jgi:2-polyprenyl-6-methoxyphenol hydroxylase-like FAD-dependent oxidoreductase